jgi:long-chain acyl-CoA synthetase
VEIKNIILTNITESLPFLKKLVAKRVLKGVYERLPEVPRSIKNSKDFLRLEELIRKYPPDPPKVEINANDTVTLQYTGGTTGPPKGSIATHFNFISCELSYQTFMQFKEGKEVLIAYMPFYHAAGVLISLINGICRGFKQVIITTPDLDKILNSISVQGATFFIGAPAIYELLKDYEKTDRVNWKGLKVVISTADALNVATAKDWHNRTGVSLHEGWGMTECTSANFGNPIGRAKLGSIGIPYPNVTAAILDPDEDKFVPPGELGELVISGPTVTKGYWNNSEATKDCEAVIDGVRLWRTGDLARMDEDGFFYIFDRKRDLIKYKGLRIFAREVEEVIKSHPKIKDVCVIGVKDIKVGENVKAFVVLEPDARGSLPETEIIDFCKDKLAPYKIPKIVEFVGEIPKTDVGKVSRRELREAVE